MNKTDNPFVYDEKKGFTIKAEFLFRMYTQSGIRPEKVLDYALKNHKDVGIQMLLNEAYSNNKVNGDK